MDGSRFDDLTKALARGRSRRHILQALAGAVGGGLLALTGRDAAAAPGKGGKPQGRCPAGYTNCRGKCVILAADENNCGACAVVCPAGWDCCAGACRSPESFLDDVGNCGACGTVCAANELCCAGTCVPNDEDNCGTCGNSCDGAEVCCAGTCTCGTCADGEVCTGDLLCFGDCGCPGVTQRCGGDKCTYCPGEASPDPITCACVCPLTAADCNATTQTFNAAECTCECNDPATFDCGSLCCDRATESCNFDGTGYVCRAL